MRSVVSIVLIMMLSACGLNQPGTSDSANGAEQKGTELPVVQQPAEMSGEQMQSGDSNMASMEASGNAQAQEMTSETADSGAPGVETESVAVDAAQQPAAAAEGEQGDISKKPVEQQPDSKG